MRIIDIGNENTERSWKKMVMPGESYYIESWLSSYVAHIKYPLRL